MSSDTNDLLSPSDNTRPGAIDSGFDILWKLAEGNWRFDRYSSERPRPSSEAHSSKTDPMNGIEERQTLKSRPPEAQQTMNSSPHRSRLPTNERQSKKSSSGDLDKQRSKSSSRSSNAHFKTPRTIDASTSRSGHSSRTLKSKTMSHGSSSSQRSDQMPRTRRTKKTPRNKFSGQRERQFNHKSQSHSTQKFRVSSIDSTKTFLKSEEKKILSLQDFQNRAIIKNFESLIIRDLSHYQSLEKDAVFFHSKNTNLSSLAAERITRIKAIISCIKAILRILSKSRHVITVAKKLERFTCERKTLSDTLFFLVGEFNHWINQNKIFCQETHSEFNVSCCVCLKPDELKYPQFAGTTDPKNYSFSIRNSVLPFVQKVGERAHPQYIKTLGLILKSGVKRPGQQL